MKKFVFRLAAVQNLRVYAEKQQKDALAREQQALTRLEQEEAALAAQEEIWSRRYLELCEQGTRPQRLAQVQAYLCEQRAQRRKNARRQREQREAVEKARELLLEKVRDRKSMDALYQKQLHDYLYEQKLQAEKELEEQVSVRTARTG